MKLQPIHRIILIGCMLLILAMLHSCQGDPQSVSNKGDFKVEFLFEQDGCKIYRFDDGIRSIYWANCSGKMQYDYEQSTGKSVITHHEESITTEQP